MNLLYFGLMNEADRRLQLLIASPTLLSANAGESLFDASHLHKMFDRAFSALSRLVKPYPSVNDQLDIEAVQDVWQSHAKQFYYYFKQLDVLLTAIGRITFLEGDYNDDYPCDVPDFHDRFLVKGSVRIERTLTRESEADNNPHTYTLAVATPRTWITYSASLGEKNVGPFTFPGGENYYVGLGINIESATPRRMISFDADADGQLTSFYRGVFSLKRSEIGSRQFFPIKQIHWIPVPKTSINFNFP